MGRKIINLGGNKIPPIIKCPHCTNELPMDIDPWKHDITRLMEDKCPRCGGKIVVGLLIIADVDTRPLLQTVQAITKTVNQQRLFQGGI